MQIGNRKTTLPKYQKYNHTKLPTVKDKYNPPRLCRFRCYALFIYHSLGLQLCSQFRFTSVLWVLCKFVNEQFFLQERITEKNVVVCLQMLLKEFLSYILRNESQEYLGLYLESYSLFFLLLTLVCKKNRIFILLLFRWFSAARNVLVNLLFEYTMTVLLLCKVKEFEIFWGFQWTLIDKSLCCQFTALSVCKL